MTKEHFLDTVALFASEEGRNRRARESAEEAAVFDAEFSRLVLKVLDASDALTNYCQVRLEHKEGR